ncbi:MAG TPA: hypothetical protein VGR63_15270 [Casimicrobiaceae bacterium]|jgi:hypothetical protein|nr:hypothetical protein [Casimicrobiaceae bacterium]
MSVRPQLATLRLPRATGANGPRTAEFNAAMQQLEQGLAGVATQGGTPAFPAVILTAADGSSWRVLVQPDGTLTTSAVPR